MDAIEQLKQDVREGRIGLDRLVDLVATSQRQLQAANQRIDELQKQIETLQKQIGGGAPVKVEQPYSVRAEEKRQEARKKRKKGKPKPVRRGRLTTAAKIAVAL